MLVKGKNGNSNELRIKMSVTNRKSAQHVIQIEVYQLSDDEDMRDLGRSRGIVPSTPWSTCVSCLPQCLR